MTPGSLLLYISTILMVFSCIAAVRWSRGNAQAEKTFRLLYYGMTAALGLASILLMVAILRHDFRFDYVINFTSRDLPLLYLVSAFWAGQQGTFLLWALMSAVMGVFLYRRNTWERGLVMAVYTPTVGFLLALMMDPGGNPFRLVATVPADGHGLNQLLQDPWMASHPPAVFLGYAALTIPAALAMVALIRGDDKGWLVPSLRWSLVGFITLGVGIILGGFWAYKVLGWGGYWGWDPVENASLIPWITVTALIHGLLVQKATGALRRTNLALALGSYILVIYATFLTRSGVLADFSVHSFPKGTLFRVLVGILLSVVVISAWALFQRWNGFSPNVPFTLNWPMVLASVVLILSLSGVLVAVATSWPIISPWLSGQAAAIDTSFYNKVNLPLFILILALLSVAPLLTWMGPAQRLLQRLAGPLVVAVVAVGLVLRAGLPANLSLVLFFFAVLSVATSTMRIVQQARRNPMRVGAPVAHLGFALMFVGVVGSTAWSTEETVSLPLGQSVQVGSTTLTYKGHVDGSEPQHRWLVGVQEGSGSESEYELTLYKIEEPGRDAQFMRKPAIVRQPLKDLYLIATGIERPKGAFHDIQLRKGETLTLHDTQLTFQAFTMQESTDGHSMTVLAQVEAVTGDLTETIALPFGANEQGDFVGRPVTVPGLPDTTLTIHQMSVDQGVLLVRAQKGNEAPSPPTMVMQAGNKPMMSVLWVGTLLLCLGCVVAWVRRVREAGAQVENKVEDKPHPKRRSRIAAV